MALFTQTLSSFTPTLSIVGLVVDRKVGSDYGEHLAQYERDRPIVIYGNGGNDFISGATKNDALYGGSGYDRLYGWEGDDLLDGGSEADELDGGTGADVITGGSGGDWFHFFAGSTDRAANKFDIVTDFNAAEGDRLILTMKVPDGSAIPNWQNVYAGSWNHMVVETTAKTMQEALLQADGLRPAPSIQVLQLYNAATKTSFLLADLDPVPLAKPSFETAITFQGVSAPIPVESIF